jgi:hypothetical protein
MMIIEKPPLHPGYSRDFHAGPLLTGILRTDDTEEVDAAVSAELDSAA